MEKTLIFLDMDNNSQIFDNGNRSIRILLLREQRSMHNLIFPLAFHAITKWDNHSEDSIGSIIQASSKQSNSLETSSLKDIGTYLTLWTLATAPSFNTILCSKFFNNPILPLKTFGNFCNINLLVVSDSARIKSCSLLLEFKIVCKHSWSNHP